MVLDIGSGAWHPRAARRGRRLRRTPRTAQCQMAASQGPGAQGHVHLKCADVAVGTATSTGEPGVLGKRTMAYRRGTTEAHGVLQCRLKRPPWESPWWASPSSRPAALLAARPSQPSPEPPPTRTPPLLAGPAAVTRHVVGFTTQLKERGCDIRALTRWRAMARQESARHVRVCLSTQDSTVPLKNRGSPQNALDDVAGNICQALSDGVSLSRRNLALSSAAALVLLPTVGSASAAADVKGSFYDYTVVGPERYCSPRLWFHFVT